MPYSSKAALLVASCKEFQREKTSRLPDVELPTAFHCLRGNFQNPILNPSIFIPVSVVCVCLHTYSLCLHVPISVDHYCLLHYCRGKHAAKVLTL